MRVHAVAVDYDGTIACEGSVPEQTVKALLAVRESGRKTIMVTGRILDDLLAVFNRLDAFDLVVAENGGLLFDPATHEREVLGEAPPRALVADLKRRDVPFDTGNAIIATVEPHDLALLQAIRDSGGGWQVIYNKGSVMALPAAVNKASGLQAALERLGISEHNTVGIGDAENDHAFLALCEVTGAPGNALPAIKDRVDIVMRPACGRGTAAFLSRHVATDFADAASVFEQFSIEIGHRRGGVPVSVPVYGTFALVVGGSGSGKSTLTGVLLEQLTAQDYHVCVIDPEGDYQAMEPLVVIGSPAAAPSIEEIEIALKRGTEGVVVNLVAQSLSEKQRFGVELLSLLAAVRATTGRPHWVVIDEAHHLFPAGPPAGEPPKIFEEQVCLVTMQPDLLHPSLLEKVTTVFAVGDEAGNLLTSFTKARGLPPPPAGLQAFSGEALMLTVAAKRAGKPVRFRVSPRRTEHRRHLRKYSAGDLGDRSFIFRGPDRRLSLRAYNVGVFVEMANGVDLDTWTYHFKKGDVAKWFLESVKDPALADEIAAVQLEDRPADSGREKVVSLIRARYST